MAETFATSPERDLGRGLAVIGAALLVSLLAGWFGMTAGLDRFLFHLLATWRPQAPLSEARVVGLSAQPADLGDPAFWQTLNAAGPARVVLLFVPEDDAVTALLAQQENLLLGRALLPREDGVYQVQSVPAALANLPWALSAFGAGGVHFQQTSYAVDGTWLPTLEYKLARPDQPVGQARRFRLRYPARGRYPAVLGTARALAAGEFPAATLADKTVLIARRLPPEDAEFARLPASGGQLVSRLAYHMTGLTTLQNRAEPLEAAPWLVWPALLIAALALTALYQRLPTRATFRAALLIALGLPLLAWLLLFANLWLFVADLMLLNLWVVFFLVLQENTILAATLNRQILDTSGFMQRRYTPKSFYATEEHWSQVANMIKQMLHIRRTIFLDRVVGDHRCREVIAVNCSLEDIYEMRRDYERTPYTLALDANGPIRMQRTYLKDQPENEAQYLIPLVFAGEVNGFWALGIEEEDIGDVAQFEAALGETAVEIAEMLYHRRRFMEAESEKSLLPELLAFNQDRALAQLLRESTALMERHVLRFESIFHGQHTGVLIYDMFGQVLMINDGMAEALSGVDFAPYDNSLADLLQLLGGYDDVQAKRLVLDILRRDQQFSFPLNLSNQRSVLLVLRPLRSLSEEVEASPFSKLGVLCEMVDITDLARLSQVKEKMIRQTTMVLRNDIMGLSMAHELITQPDVPEADKQQMMAIANEKMASLKQLLEEGSGYLKTSSFDTSSPFFPIEFAGLLQQVVGEAEKLLAQRDLTLDLEKPELMNFVLASPNQLKDLLLAVFRLMAEDAEKKSVLSLRIGEKDGLLSLRFVNQGYGIPERQLAKIRGTDRDLDHKTGRDLQRNLRYLADWQGDYQLSSEIGKGTSCTIRLKVFG
ncbi:hypothetical protein [Acanthopleuribacter pedis]|uniref:Histidine kinase domain-containing protein n=1 Tax=Acanthopleuribacter pedis TaxID=442870 RepID=A0A8J7U5Q6_9BACT|nr:hypothetical protein [Acanthopleuribacter pedis]MBO1321104.1 hypothetical protein [Acanthopleuribacter pedis]